MDEITQRLQRMSPERRHYTLDALSRHLAAAGKKDKLFTLVGRPWMDAQLERTGAHAASVADLEIALEVAAEEPVAIAAFVRSCLFQSALRTEATEMPPAVIGALAASGHMAQALDWASLHPDPHARFEGLALVAEALLGAGDRSRLRPILEEAVSTIARLGQTFETGYFPELTELNAIHALVRFPHPGQWEGTTQKHVDLAQIPLDATIRLMPLLFEADLLSLAADIHHSFWGLYDNLLPRLAAAHFAANGEAELSRAILSAVPDVNAPPGAEDIAHAARYRESVAWAALGEHQRAIEVIEAIANHDYRSVGYHQIAVHAAEAGRFDLALRLVDAIDDEIEQTDALVALVPALIAQPEADRAQALASRLMALDQPAEAAAALTAGGYVDEALATVEKEPPAIDGMRMRLLMAQTLVAVGERVLSGQFADQITAEIRRQAGVQWLGLPYASDEQSRPDEQQIDVILELVNLLVDTDRLQLCIESLETLPDATVKATAAVDLAGLLASMGQMSEVLALVERFDQPYVRSALLANAIAQADDVTDLATIRAAAEQLLNLHRRLSSTEAAELPLPSVAETLALFDLADLAVTWAERLDDPYEQMAARGEGALAYIRTGDMIAAKHLATSFKPIRHPLPGLTGFVSTLCSAARALDRIGEAEEGGKVVNLAAGLVTELPIDAAALAVEVDVAHTLAELGKVERAKTLAESIGGWDSTELLQLLFTGATEVSERLTLDPYIVAEVASLADAQANALASIAVLLAQKDQVAEATETTHKAVALATLSSMMGLTGAGTSSAARALTFTGATEEAIDLAAGDASTLTQVAVALGQIGKPQEALSLIDRVLAHLDGPFELLEKRHQRRVIHVDELWGAEREQGYARMRILATAVEIAVAAGAEREAARYASEATEALRGTFGTSADQARAFSTLAETFHRIGQEERAREFLDEARSRALEDDSDPPSGMSSPLLDIALAMSRIGESGQAQKIWLSEMAQARFADHRRVLATSGAGLECLANASRIAEVIGITRVLLEFEEQSNIALLVADRGMT